jgi:hypothetical protein
MQVEIHVTELLVHEPSPSEAENAIENLKSYKSLSTELPMAELNSNSR